MTEFFIFNERQFSVREFEQGRGQCFLLVNEQQCLVMRRLQQQHNFWRFDYQRQAQILQELEPRGWAAKLLSQDQNYQIWQFLEGQAIEDKLWRDPRTFDQLCRFLDAMRQPLKCDKERFDLSEYIEVLIEACELSSENKEELNHSFFKQCRELSQELRLYSRIGLNHHDLYNDNFLLQSDGRLRVLDWEYLSHSSYGWDWVYCSLHLNLSSAQKEQLQSQSGLSLWEWQLLELASASIDKLWSTASMAKTAIRQPTQ
ncbi:hypothetical protein DBZ36_08850 [Alginatibacterium sediminis]|uniref:Uncharacterized protein n=1 Tax=Alginatibacterium sediminis TaxID=2164068 RepID=A0A420ECS7_9ALTE|nr:phosphotransferase [Alginatibacterium sediminis]RKF18507.1 hypothetical protein DBZ36_08850 [Alginatibacterium sediminis]